MTIQQKIKEAVTAIRARTDIAPKAAVVLGSGLGSVAEAIENKVVIPYGDIPHWPVSTAVGHAGRLVMGELGGVPVAAMEGRVHFYEGYSMEDIVFPVRVFGALGVKTYFATNASGGIDLGCAPGELAAIYDHINYMGTNPLIGPNDDSLGPRFPDMSYAYDRDYLALLDEVAREQGITLRHAVYIAFTGPSYETPAEIRMARVMGADVVGMSTVPEVIAANHMGMRVAAVSCVANYAAGVTSDKLAHEDVVAGMQRAAKSLAPLMIAFFKKISVGI